MNDAPRRTIVPTAVKAAVACCLVACAGVGGALAYLTDTDSIVNRFTVVPALDIEVVEEQWDAYPDEDGDGVPDHAEEIVPTQTIVKDPAIDNLAGTEAWIFAEISVPTYSVRVVGEDGRVTDLPELTELFAYALNDGWEEMGQPSFDADLNVTVHRYAWTTPVDPGARTGTVFDAVTFANLADNQLDMLVENGQIVLQIDIAGFGIQTETFASWADAWDAYVGQHS